MSLIRPIEPAVIPPHVIRQLLDTAETIAVVGASTDPWRPSFGIAGYLKRHGYRIRPVNPHETGHILHGEPFHSSLGDIPGQIDLAVIFRRPDALMEVVEEAIAAGVPAIWAQLGIYDEAARRKAVDAGMTAVMNRCISIEHSRLRITR